eukprot:TRINITY_DN41740_c0_g1_i1.p1 TRINITY_DN41740_c0_g1~~TRINITY_DN41740_c0_g1_i1.p1  ORF type:complete len:1506 (-),score=256.24 TRINITY_DN41740_c0_g1_i1:248-4735(-)
MNASDRDDATSLGSRSPTRTTYQASMSCDAGAGGAPLESIVEVAVTAQLSPLRSAVRALEERVRNLASSEMEHRYANLLETQQLHQRTFNTMQQQIEAVKHAASGTISASGFQAMPASFPHTSSPVMGHSTLGGQALSDRISTLEAHFTVEFARLRSDFRALAERISRVPKDQEPKHFSSSAHDPDGKPELLRDPIIENQLHLLKRLKPHTTSFGVQEEDELRMDAAHVERHREVSQLRPRAADTAKACAAEVSVKPNSMRNATGGQPEKTARRSSVGNEIRKDLDEACPVDGNDAIGSEPDQDSLLPPLLLHFDVNKTVMLTDTVSLKSAEEGIRESISELFWGLCKDKGGNPVWTWTKTKPSCYPPEGFGDCVFDDSQLINYVEFCKKAMKDKSSRKAATKTWGLVTDQATRARMEKLFKSSVKRLQLWSEVRYTKEANDAGLPGTTLQMFPAIFAVVAFLQRSKRKFSILFRSFGEDHKNIQKEWNAFCEMRHPIFSHLLEGIGPLDGSVPGVPDRRISCDGLHTLYRDADGPVLILNTFTNGPPGSSSWDAWAKTKPKAKQDLRGGREFIKNLKTEYVDGMRNFRNWIHKHTLAERTGAIKDDWAWWHWSGERTEAGKLLTVTEGQDKIKQIFFDDNIEYHDARIVDCRYTNNDCLPLKVAQEKVIVKVNPVEVLNDEDFFIKTIQRLHGDHLNMGYALAFDRFYQVVQSSAADQFWQRTMLALDASSPSHDDEFVRLNHALNSPKLLSLLFCYVQMLPRKGRDRYLPLRPHVSPEKISHGEGVTVTGVYRVAIDLLLKQALTQHQFGNHGMLHAALSKQQASDANDDDLFEQCRLILEVIAMAIQKERRTCIGILEIARVLPPELQKAWFHMRPCLVGDQVQLLQVSKERSTDEVNFMVRGMQNFLVASMIARTGTYSDLPALEQLLTDPWWSQALNILAEAYPESYVKLVEERLQSFDASNGRSFLHIAATVGHEPMFHLLRLFSKENQQALYLKTLDLGHTAMHVAAGKGNDNLCSLIIDHSSAIDTEDKEGCWALHVAMQNGHFQTARLVGDEWLKSKRGSNTQCFLEASSNSSEQLAMQILGSEHKQLISEAEFLDAVNNIFVELRYFDKTGDMVEKKREVGALLAVYWIVSNQYDQFVRSQAPAARLSQESWGKLQDWTRRTVNLTENVQHVQAMLVFVAIMGVGKIKTFRTAFTPECHEFNEALVKVLQHAPFTFPSFARLGKESQQMILSCLMASDFNFGQFLQAENTPANLLVVKEISHGDKSILGFFLFKIFAAMCGILGMKSLEGSLFMGEKMYTNFKVGLEVLQHLESDSPQQVYNRFLAERAHSQGLAFDASVGESRAVVRLACMARVFDSENGSKVRDAFGSLDAAERERLSRFLNADGIEEKPAILLYNAPNLLQNGSENPHVGLERAFRMLLWIYDAAAKTFKGSDSHVITIMVDEIVPVVANCRDPDMLALIGFDIARAVGDKGDSQGIVVVKD